MFGTSRTDRAFANKLILIFYCLLFTNLTACTSLLPTGKKTTAAPCNTYDDCTKMFDKITPYGTTVADLDKLKLNPAKTANMERLNYSNIVDRFNYSVEHADTFPRGVRECIQIQEECIGYDLIIKHINSERTGNTLLDLFQFKRVTEKSGWIFKTLLVVKGDMVVYKLRGGTPKVDETNVSKKPLGFFQDNIGSYIGGIIGGYIGTQ